ncbi:MAG: hypothetical protein ACXAEU_11575 [Candidatus Hodarchaeales archaeon]
MAESKDVWRDLTNEQRKKEIVVRRARNETWKEISLALRGSKKRYQAIWSWARNNLEPEYIGKGKKNELQTNIIKLLREIKEEQEKKFTLTASFLDTIEDRLSQVSKKASSLDSIEKRIKRALAPSAANKKSKSRDTILPTISRPLHDERTAQLAQPDHVQSTPRPLSRPPSLDHTRPPPASQVTPPPPPPPRDHAWSTSPRKPAQSPTPRQFSQLSSNQQQARTSLSREENTTFSPPPVSRTSSIRTDFEKMTMEDFRALPTDFLVSLSTTDRTRVQERVRELKMLEKMTVEERNEYLEDKQKEKRKMEASKELGGSLKAMLGDNDSLFSKMRRAADQSGIAGKGTFGNFFTDYIYSYCFSCGKTSRDENEAAQECQYCQANSNLMVLDEEKTNHYYYECLDCKSREWVNPSLSRGNQIIIRSRWKIGRDEEKKHCPFCMTRNIRDITSSVLVAEDPDTQFSYYITLFRLYQQVELPVELQNLVWDLYEQLQELVDVGTRKMALFVAERLLEHLVRAIKWIGTSVVVRDQEFVNDLETIKSVLIELNDPESGLYLKRINEIAQITSRMDQLLNLFINLSEKIRNENIL